jgi:hypothetical protein
MPVHAQPTGSSRRRRRRFRRSRSVRRLLLVRAADRSALGSSGRAVPLGDGAGGLGEFFLAAYRAGIKPLSIAIAASGATAAAYMKDVSGFERVMGPAMAERVRTMLDSPAGRIRGPEKLDADMRRRRHAAHGDRRAEEWS